MIARKYMHHALTLFLGIVLVIGSAPVQGTSQGSSLEAQAPEYKFAIIPVGDHPDGFFNNLEFEPGESRTLEVDLVNLSSVEVAFDFYVVNAGMGVNGGFVAGEVDEELTEPATWIELDPVEVVLAPEGVERVPFTLTVPNETPPGQYISGLVMGMQESQPIPGTSQLEHKLQYAITVSVLVPGELEYSFEMEAPVYLPESKSIVVPLTNTGSYLVRPQGTLLIYDTDGNEVVATEIRMGSVYAGLTSAVGIALPPHLEDGEYLVSISLFDQDSGSSTELLDQPVLIAQQAVSDPLTVEQVSIEANAEVIAFANVEIAIENATSPIQTTNVNLIVMLDGEEVDTYPLATNQILLNGINTYATRYIPSSTWEPGTYIFRLELHSVNPHNGEQIELLVEDLDAEIVVP